MHGQFMKAKLETQLKKTANAQEVICAVLGSLRCVAVYLV
jgi:hypothetical protein